MNNNNVLVTGSNSGFGRLISLALARRGHRVFATMRAPTTKNQAAAAELRAIADTEKLSLQVVELDVTDDRSVSTAVQLAQRSAGHIDVVVNNAGYAVSGLSETLTSAQVLAELDTNVVGAHRVNRAVLPALRERRAGLLIHISSTMGRLTAPFNGIYSGSKWALEAMAESYRYELKSTGVEVSIVQPGVFKTGIVASSVTGADAERAAGYGLDVAYAKLQAMVDAMHTGPGASDPEEVARAVVTLVEAPAGSRPLRVVVDPSGGGVGTEALNQAAADIQRGLLTALGLSEMLG
jgi:NAD(P)-dependent dehydrogenase (short-subunit alcohol dehydrogenase family)